MPAIDLGRRVGWRTLAQLRDVRGCIIESKRWAGKLAWSVWASVADELPALRDDHANELSGQWGQKRCVMMYSRWVVDMEKVCE